MIFFSSLKKRRSTKEGAVAKKERRLEGKNVMLYAAAVKSCSAEKEICLVTGRNADKLAEEVTEDSVAAEALDVADQMPVIVAAPREVVRHNGEVVISDSAKSGERSHAITAMSQIGLLQAKRSSL